MALEIERRFRVSSDAWRASVARSTRITQGYLAITEYSVIRVRVRDATGYVTIKSRDGGIARDEFEYPIPLDDARSLLDLCGQRILTKSSMPVTAGKSTSTLSLSKISSLRRLSCNLKLRIRRDRPGSATTLRTTGVFRTLRWLNGSRPRAGTRLDEERSLEFGTRTADDTGLGLLVLSPCREIALPCH